jgi:hypothetical protein
MPPTIGEFLVSNVYVSLFVLLVENMINALCYGFPCKCSVVAANSSLFNFDPVAASKVQDA